MTTRGEDVELPELSRVSNNANVDFDGEDLNVNPLYQVGETGGQPQSALDLHGMSTSSSQSHLSKSHLGNNNNKNKKNKPKHQQGFCKRNMTCIIIIAVLVIAGGGGAGYVISSSSSSESSSSTTGPSSKEMYYEVAGGDTFDLAAFESSLETLVQAPSPDDVRVELVDELPATKRTIRVGPTGGTPRTVFVHAVFTGASSQTMVDAFVSAVQTSSATLSEMGIIDVVSKDADLSSAPSLPPVCPERCNGHGSCVDGSCQCEHGWGPTTTCRDPVGWVEFAIVSSLDNVTAVEPGLRITVSGDSLVYTSTQPGEFEYGPSIPGTYTITVQNLEGLYADASVTFTVTQGQTAQVKVIMTAIVSMLVEASPSDLETGVALTRETILIFSAGLDQEAFANAVSVVSGEDSLGFHITFSPDSTRATLFYTDNLPPSARVVVHLDGSTLTDGAGRPIDLDGEGSLIAGESRELRFDTLSVSALEGTVVCGRVFASELLEVGASGVNTSLNTPLANVTITVDGREDEMWAMTDATGSFRLEPAPAGRFFVHIDGRTQTSIDISDGAYYPFVGKAWESVPGTLANIGNVFLPRIPPETLQVVSETEETEIRLAPSVVEEFPEFAEVRITVPPDSLYSDDGTRGGQVGIAPVPPDRLPGELPDTLDFPLVITVQATATNFARPAPICFPNVGNLPAGSGSALWSFDHDIGRFMMQGRMTVSDDGTLVCTDKGVGIRAPGWHATAPGNDPDNDPPEDDDDCDPPPGDCCPEDKKPKPNPPPCVPNGCGPEGKWYSALIPNWPFGPCCDKHDCCYSECGKKRGSCDLEFLGCNLRRCKYTVFFPKIALACAAGAAGYAGAVGLGGQDPYDKAQDDRCECPGSKYLNPFMRYLNPPGRGKRKTVPIIADYYYKIYINETDSELRGTAPNGVLPGTVIIPPNIHYYLAMYEPTRNKVAAAFGVSGGNGGRTRVPRMLLLDARAFNDTDSDGLCDLCEDIIGTDFFSADTDSDGINDYAEILQGTDPLGGAIARTGLIASAATAGTAYDLCFFSDERLAVLDSRAGLLSFNAFNGMNPIVLSQSSVPGAASSFSKLACSDASPYVAVSSNNRILVYSFANTRVNQPTLWRTHQLTQTATAILQSAGILYVALPSSLILLDLNSGLELVSLPLVDGPVLDMAISRFALYMVSNSKILTLDLDDPERDGITSVSAGSSNVRRVHVGENNLYVGLKDGFNVFDISADAFEPALTNAANLNQFGWLELIPDGSGQGVGLGGPNSGNNRDIQVYDVSDPSTDQFITTHALPGANYALALFNGLAYAVGSDGLHVVNYLAYDNQRNPPQVSFTTNLDDSNPEAEEGSILVIQAVVRDDVLVRNVEFYVDGALVSVDGSFPFQYEMRVPLLTTQSSLTISVLGRDTGGNTARTPPTTIPIVPDNTPPYVRKTVPANGGRIPVTQQSVAVRFSESLQNLLFASNVVQLFGVGPDGLLDTADDVVIPSQWSYQATLNTIILRADDPLQAQPYRVRLTATSVKDLAGNALEEAHSFAFRVVEESRIAFGSSAVGILAPIDGHPIELFGIDMGPLEQLGLTDPFGRVENTRAWDFTATSPPSLAPVATHLDSDDLVTPEPVTFINSSLELRSQTGVQIPLLPTIEHERLQSYTFSFRILFDAIRSYNKILDLSQLSSDYGLYLRSGGRFQVYPWGEGIAIPDAPTIVTNRFYNITITRDANSLDLFVDSVLANRWPTSHSGYGFMVLPSSALGLSVYLFRDDGNAGETTTGRLERLSFTAAYLYPREIDTVTSTEFGLSLIAKYDNSFSADFRVTEQLEANGNRTAVPDSVGTYRRYSEYPVTFFEFPRFRNRTGDRRSEHSFRCEVEAPANLLGGTFQLSLGSLPPLISSLEELTVGISSYRVSELRNPAQFHWYKFTGTAAQGITVVVDSEGFRPRVTIQSVNSDNTPAFDIASYSSSGRWAVLSFSPPHTGTYRLRISGNVFDGSGLYVVALYPATNLPAPTPTELSVSTGALAEMYLAPGTSRLFSFAFDSASPSRTVSARFAPEGHTERLVSALFSSEVIPQNVQDSTFDVTSCHSTADSFLGASAVNLTVGDEFTFNCKVSCSASGASVYGHHVYDGRSGICRAAIHAGALRFPYIGPVAVRLQQYVPVSTSYTRFGVSARTASVYTSGLGEYDLGFYFSDCALRQPDLCNRRLLSFSGSERLDDASVPSADTYYLWAQQLDLSIPQPIRYKVGLSTQGTRGVTPITAFNEAIKGALVSLADVHEWSFEVQPGDRIRVYATGTSLSYSITAADGSSTLSTNRGLTMDSATTYHVRIWSSANYADYTLYVFKHIPQETPIPTLTYGAVYRDIWPASVGGEETAYEYRFITTSQYINRPVTITSQVETSRSHSMHMFYEYSNGTRVFLGSRSGSMPRFEDFVPTVAGDYILRVWHGYDGRYAHRIALSDQPEDGHVQAWTDRRAPVHGYITFGDVDTYRFSAVEGETMTITSSYSNYGIDLIYEPNGTSVVPSATYTYTFTFPATGSYLARVAPRAASYARYAEQYTVQMVWESDVVDIAFDETKTVFLDELAGITRMRFTVSAAEQNRYVVVQSRIMHDGSGDSTTYRLPAGRIYRPDGTQYGTLSQGRRADVYLSQTGTWRFEIDVPKYTTYTDRTLLASLSRSYGPWNATLNGDTFPAAEYTPVTLEHVYPVYFSGMSPFNQYAYTATYSGELEIAMHTQYGTLRVFDDTGAQIDTKYRTYEPTSTVNIEEGRRYTVSIVYYYGWQISDVSAIVSFRNATSPVYSDLPADASLAVPASNEIELNRHYLLTYAEDETTKRFTFDGTVGQAIRPALRGFPDKRATGNWNIKLVAPGHHDDPAPVQSLFSITPESSFGWHFTLPETGTYTLEISFTREYSHWALFSLFDSRTTGAALSVGNPYALTTTSTFGEETTHTIEGPLAASSFVVFHTIQYFFSLNVTIMNPDNYVVLSRDSRLSPGARVIIPADILSSTGTYTIVCRTHAPRTPKVQYTARLMTGSTSPTNTIEEVPSVDSQIEVEEAQLQQSPPSYPITETASLLLPAQDIAAASTFNADPETVSLGNVISAEAPVEFGSLDTTSRLSDGGSRSFTFVVREGDDVFVALRTSGFFKGDMTILDQNDNVVLATSTTGSVYVPYISGDPASPSTDTITYTAVVRGFGFGGGVFSFTRSRLHAPYAEAQLRQLLKAIQDIGLLELSTDVHLFAFEAITGAPSALELTVSPVSSKGAAMQVDIFEAASGRLVAEGSADGRSSKLLAYLQPGTYTVRVRFASPHLSSGQSGYVITADVPETQMFPETQPAPATPLPLNSPTSTSPSWTTARALLVLDITAAELNRPLDVVVYSGARPHFEIYTPAGYLLARSSDRTYQRLTITPIMVGSYRILLQDFRAWGSAIYAGAAHRVQHPALGTVRNIELTNTIANVGETHVYPFSGTAGDFITVESYDSTFDFRILDSRGNLLQSSVSSQPIATLQTPVWYMQQVRLSHTGTYHLEVQPDEVHRTGDFRILIGYSELATVPQAIDFEMSYPAHLPSRNSRKVFTIDVTPEQAGGVGNILVQRWSKGRPHAQLYAPGDWVDPRTNVGALDTPAPLVDELSDHNNYYAYMPNVVFETAGTYTLVVTDWRDSRHFGSSYYSPEGEFFMVGLSLPTPRPITDSEVREFVTDFIPHMGAVREFWYNATANETISVESTVGKFGVEVYAVDTETNRRSTTPLAQGTSPLYIIDAYTPEEDTTLAIVASQRDTSRETGALAVTVSAPGMVTDEPVPLEPGSVAHAHLTRRGDRYVFVVSVGAGDVGKRMHIVVSRSSENSNFQSRVELYTPGTWAGAGTSSQWVRVDNSYSSNYPAEIIDYVIEEAGDYHISTWDRRETSSAAFLASTYRVAVHIEEPVPLPASNERLEAYIHPMGDIDDYSFDADAGEIVTVRVTPSSLRLTIYDSDYNVIDGGGSNNGVQTLSNVVLPSTGTYIVRVVASSWNSHNADLSTPYDIILWRVSREPVPGTLVFGVPQGGKIPTRNARQQYTMTVSAGQVGMHVDVTAYILNSRARLEIYGPEVTDPLRSPARKSVAATWGNSMAMVTDFVLTESGDWTVAVSDVTVDDNQRPFTVVAVLRESIPLPSFHYPIHDTLDFRGDVDWFEFATDRDNQQMRLEMQNRNVDGTTESGSAFQQAIWYQHPTTQELQYVGRTENNADWEFVCPLAGTYLLRISQLHYSTLNYAVYGFVLRPYTSAPTDTTALTSGAAAVLAHTTDPDVTAFTYTPSSVPAQVRIVSGAQMDDTSVRLNLYAPGEFGGNVTFASSVSPIGSADGRYYWDSAVIETTLTELRPYTLTLRSRDTLHAGWHDVSLVEDDGSSRVVVDLNVHQTARLLTSAASIYFVVNSTKASQRIRYQVNQIYGAGIRVRSSRVSSEESAIYHDAPTSTVDRTLTSAHVGDAFVIRVSADLFAPCPFTIRIWDRDNTTVDAVMSNTPDKSSPVAVTIGDTDGAMSTLYSDADRAPFSFSGTADQQVRIALSSYTNTQTGFSIYFAPSGADADMSTMILLRYTGTYSGGTALESFTLPQTGEYLVVAQSNGLTNTWYKGAVVLTVTDRGDLWANPQTIAVTRVHGDELGTAAIAGHHIFSTFVNQSIASSIEVQMHRDYDGVRLMLNLYNPSGHLVLETSMGAQSERIVLTTEKWLLEEGTYRAEIYTNLGGRPVAFSIDHREQRPSYIMATSNDVTAEDPLPEAGTVPSRAVEQLSVLPGNLIVNADAEVNTMSGWEGGNFYTSACSGDKPCHSGRYFFHPPAEEMAEMHQVIDLSGDLHTAIDAGTQQMLMSMWYKSWDQDPADTCSMTVEFYAEGADIGVSAPLLTRASGELASRTTWTEWRCLINAPALARSARVRLISNRYSGSNNDGYYDDIALVPVTDENRDELDLPGLHECVAQDDGSGDAQFGTQADLEASVPHVVQFPSGYGAKYFQLELAAGSRVRVMLEGNDFFKGGVRLYKGEAVAEQQDSWVALSSGWSPSSLATIAQLDTLLDTSGTHRLVLACRGDGSGPARVYFDTTPMTPSVAPPQLPLSQWANHPGVWSDVLQLPTSLVQYTLDIAEPGMVSLNVEPFQDAYLRVHVRVLSPPISHYAGAKRRVVYDSADYWSSAPTSITTDVPVLLTGSYLIEVHPDMPAWRHGAVRLTVTQRDLSGEAVEAGTGTWPRALLDTPALSATPMNFTFADRIQFAGQGNYSTFAVEVAEGDAGALLHATVGRLQSTGVRIRASVYSPPMTIGSQSLRVRMRQVLRSRNYPVWLDRWPLPLVLPGTYVIVVANVEDDDGEAQLGGVVATDSEFKPLQSNIRVDDSINLGRWKLYETDVLTAGTRVRFEMSNVRVMVWRADDPTETILVSTTSAYNWVTPHDGRLRLRVDLNYRSSGDSNADATPNFWFTMFLPRDEVSSTPLTFNTSNPVWAQINEPTSSVVLPLTVSAGQTGRLAQIVVPGVGNLQARVDLYAPGAWPHGVYSATRTAQYNGYSTGLMDLTFDVEGEYTVVIRNTRNTATDVFGVYASLQAAPGTAPPLPHFNASVTGRLNEPGDVTEYTFVAEANAFFSIFLSSNRRFEVSLVGPSPSNAVVAEKVDTKLLEYVKLDVAGTYTVRVHSQRGTWLHYLYEVNSRTNLAETFALYVYTPDLAPTPIPLPFGTSVPAVIDVRGSVVVYEIDAAEVAGADTIRLVPTPMSSLRPRYWITDAATCDLSSPGANARKCAPLESVPVEVAEHNSHAGVLETGALSGAAGSYYVIFEDYERDWVSDSVISLGLGADAPTTPVELNVNRSISGDISFVGEIDAYTFTASADQPLLVRLESSTYLGIALRTPSGEWYATEDGTTYAPVNDRTALGPVALSEPGEYMLRVSGRTDDEYRSASVGSYTLILEAPTILPTPVPLNFGDLSTFTLSLASVSVFTVTVPEGDELVWDSLDDGIYIYSGEFSTQSTSTCRARFRVFKLPDGVDNWRTHSPRQTFTSGSNRYSYSAIAYGGDSGTYTIVVDDNNNDCESVDTVSFRIGARASELSATSLATPQTFEVTELGQLNVFTFSTSAAGELVQFAINSESMRVMVDIVDANGQRRVPRMHQGSNQYSIGTTFYEGATGGQTYTVLVRHDMSMNNMVHQTGTVSLYAHVVPADPTASPRSGVAVGPTALREFDGSASEDYEQYTNAQSGFPDAGAFSILLRVNQSVFSGDTLLLQKGLSQNNTDSTMIFTRSTRNMRVYQRTYGWVNTPTGADAKLLVPDASNVVVLVWDNAARRYKIWINAELAWSTSLTRFPAQTRDDLFVGDSPNYTGVLGKVGDVRVYPFALTDEEVVAISSA